MAPRQGALRTTPRLDDPRGGLMGSESIVLTALISSSERTPNTVGKGKRLLSEVWRKPGETSKCLLPVESQRTSSCPQQRILHVRARVKCYPLGKLTRDSVLKFLIRAWSCWQPLPGTYPNSRLSDRKQESSINHIVCVNSLGTGATLIR